MDQAQLKKIIADIEYGFTAAKIDIAHYDRHGMPNSANQAIGRQQAYEHCLTLLQRHATKEGC